MSPEGSILDKIISDQGLSHLDNFHPQEALNSALALLTEREREVLTRRFGLSGMEPETLEKIGQSFQVTRERIRQIERLGIKKLHENKQVATLIQPIRQVVIDLLEQRGGVALQISLIDQLVKLALPVRPAVIRFYLDELLSDTALSFGGASTRFAVGYRLRPAILDYLTTLHETAETWIEEKGRPVAENELVSAIMNKPLKTPLGDNLNSSFVPELLLLSGHLKRNAYGEWGMRQWETITPRRMNDKIYLVLKKAGKPLHFREIARLVNEAKFDRKTAYPPTVHNELIMDSKYVLVGRGIYALKEWGYENGVVAEVIEKIFQEKGLPLTRDQIVQEVMKVRVVKPATVHLAITNKDRFEHLADGRYYLKQASL